MRLLTKLVMIVTLGITVAQPVKRAPDKGNKDCLTWIGTAPSCNVSSSDCPAGYQSVFSDQDALHTEAHCLTGTKYLCEKGIIHFLMQN